jgi:ABC-type molybdate transport system substrate-binding protein
MSDSLRASLILVVLVILVGITGCAEPPQTVSELEVITVAITPAARYTNLAVVTCAATIKEASFEISEMYASQAEADLLIRLGEPQPAASFAAQIANDELAIVLHPDNPAGSLTLDQVQQLFSGSIQNWADLDGVQAPVEVWSLLDADEARQIFIHKVLNNGLLATNAYLAPSPEIMVTSIAGKPSAIGYLPKSWTTPELASILPGVKLPVLVLADGQLQGAAARLVSCLQGEIGQEVLSAFYPN